MTNTTHIDIELTEKERFQLLEAYIPENLKHYFGSDADLNEVFQAYTNFGNDTLAEEYMNYVVSCAQSCNEHTGCVDVLTAKSWIESKAAQMSKIVLEWEDNKVENIDFGCVEIENYGE